MPLWQRTASILDCIRKIVASRSKEILLSIGKTTSGVASPVLGFPGQERHGHTGVSLAEGQEDD